MILKTLDFRKGKEANVLYDEWNYFDNIVSASNYFDEDSGMTIDRIIAAEVEHSGATEGKTLPTMQDAVDFANNR